MAAATPLALLDMELADDWLLTTGISEWLRLCAQQQPVINDSEALEAVQSGHSMLAGILCTGSRIPQEFKVCGGTRPLHLVPMLRRGQFYLLVPTADAADGVFLASAGLVNSLR